MGCATSPERDFTAVDLPVPPGWDERASQKPVSDTNWVTSFRDAKLESVVSEALEQNRDLQAVATRIQSSQATAVIAGADAKPRVTGSFDGQRLQRNFIGFPTGGGPAEARASISNTFGLSLNMNWEIDLWGRVRAGKSAALADWEATIADVEAAKLSLVGQTAKVWFAVLA
ncbi:MAG: TolC family protein, partial [Verrucomicrobiota bacterium]